MDKTQAMSVNNQFGIHYFVDTLHYRQEDLKIWLPVLKDLRIGWIVLKSEKNRAIPEDFLKSLLNEVITPIIEFNLPLRSNIGTRELKLVLQVYAKWGVKYCVFFDRPIRKIRGLIIIGHKMTWSIDFWINTSHWRNSLWMKD